MNLRLFGVLVGGPTPQLETPTSLKVPPRGKKHGSQRLPNTQTNHKALTPWPDSSHTPR